MLFLPLMVLQEVERGDDDWAGLAGVEVPCVLVGWEVEGGGYLLFLPVYACDWHFT